MLGAPARAAQAASDATAPRPAHEAALGRLGINTYIYIYIYIYTHI